MTENKVENQEAQLTEEELKKIFDSLSEEFKEAIRRYNDEVAQHNRNVETLRSALSGTKDPTLIKAEIFEQNNEPNGAHNKKLAVLRDNELKLLKQIEKIREEAYAIIEKEGLVRKEHTEEELTKLREGMAESVQELRSQAQALSKMENMMPNLKGKVTVHLHEIKTLRGRGVAKSSSTGGTSKRPRFEKIEVNGGVDDKAGNTVYSVVKKKGVDTETFNFGTTSSFLRKQHPSIKVTTQELQNLYYAGEDENNLPKVKSFDFPHTFKDANGNEQTVIYKITCYRK